MIIGLPKKEERIMAKNEFIKTLGYEIKKKGIAS